MGSGKDQGRYEEALKAFERTLSTNPRDETALVGRATALLALGRFAEAEAASDAALALYPRNPRLLSELGSLFYDQRRYGEALKAFEQTLSLEPLDETALVWRVITLQRLGRFEGAKKALEDALALRPGSIQLMNERMSLPLYREQGEANWLSRLSASAGQAFAWAEALRRAANRKHVHMEHLVLGMYRSKVDHPLRWILSRADLGEQELIALLRRSAEEKDLLPSPESVIEPVRLEAELPLLTRHVRRALEEAWRIAEEDKEPMAHSRHLLSGVLSVSDCSVIKALLARGLRPEDALTTEKPLDLAGFYSDTPSGEDLLDIQNEVAALCSVVAARDVVPPLSIGLFGDWGSGKSFFMYQMRKELGRLRDSARKAGNASPYYRDIVQIEFNAWHYIDTNLWASLTAEIFEQLAQKLSRRAKNPVATKARLLAATASSRDALAEAEKQTAQAEAELRASVERHQQLARSEAMIEADLSEGALMREAFKAAVGQKGVRDRLEQAADLLELDKAQAASAGFEKTLLELEGLSGELRAIWLSMTRSKSPMRWLLPVLVFLAVTALVWWGLVRLGGLLEHLGLLISSVSGVLVTVVATLARWLKPARQVLGLVREARETVDQRVQAEMQSREAALKQEQAQLKQKVDQAQQRVDEARARVEQFEQQLDELRADRQMAEFVKQRCDSADYTGHLGIVARARSDFERLSKLMTAVQAEPDDSKAPVPRVDRIVLYIDDLDRCPEDKVVDVLQAVHLLLAFPLFVVVVGVDSRWLLHSLRRHSRVFQGSGDDILSEEERRHWQSTPLTYLEKIFQIPFALLPMQSKGYKTLIRKVSQPPPSKAPGGVSEEADEERDSQSLEPERSGEAPVAGPSPVSPVQPVAEDARPAGAQPTPAAQTPPPPPPAPRPESGERRAETQAFAQEDVAKLRFESWEIDALETLYEFIPSPRAAKRFVNIYRLQRALLLDREWALFIGRRGVGEHRVVLLLLAMLIGHPAETTEILRDLTEGKHKGTWRDVIATYRARFPADKTDVEASGWRELLRKLEAMEAGPFALGKTKVARFAAWAPRVARFSFQSGRVALTTRRP